MHITRLLAVDSTNLEARRRVEQGERGPLWIVSAEQTHGKGRLGRHWVSKPGNFYGTLLWSTTAPQSALSQLSFVASLAVHACASKLESPDAITLKWPNDCLLNGEKFCGILCEVIALDLVAIGIGINIAHVPDDLPYKVSKLTTATVESVFEILQSSLSNYLEIWQNGQGFSRIRQLWMAHCTHLGQTVRINALSGTFEGLASDGAMQLRLKDGSLKALYAGDMRLEYGNEI